MHVYFLVYDRPNPMNNPKEYRVLVAYKNVSGTRFKNEVKPYPRVLNGAGQLVIPGGDPEIEGEITREKVIEGGRKEFFEETGIDFGKGEAPPWSELLHWGRGGRTRSYCVYQRVRDVERVSRACNENIQASRPRDEELHSTMVHNTSGVPDVCRYFGPIPEIALTSGWRGEQYNLLDARQKLTAVENSFDPGDWFVTAVELLLRSDN